MNTRSVVPHFGFEDQNSKSESGPLPPEKAREIGAFAGISLENKPEAKHPRDTRKTSVLPNVRAYKRERSSVETRPSKHHRGIETEVLRHVVAAPEGALKPLENRASQEATPRSRNLEHALHAIEQRPTLQLLKDAEGLFINGVSVRQLYESNRIDRAGLIHILKESLQGNSAAKAFENVELGRERQRERAKEFRHDDPVFTPTAAPTQITAPAQPIIPLGQLNIPSQPDADQLQPLTSSSATSDTVVDSPVTTNEHPPRPKYPYLSSVIIMALGLTTLVIWLLLG